MRKKRELVLNKKAAEQKVAELPSSFQKYIISVRIANNFSQSMLAEMLNISQQLLSMWENNEKFPTISRIKKMYDLFRSIGIRFNAKKVLEQRNEFLIKNFYPSPALSDSSKTTKTTKK